MSNPGKMMRSLVGHTLISTRAHNLKHINSPLACKQFSLTDIWKWKKSIMPNRLTVGMFTDQYLETTKSSGSVAGDDIIP